PAVPAELETIVLKAMAKAPAERYATAQELADDLRRFLDDKPIRARRPTLVQRARKWMRRHQTVVLTLLVAAVVMLGLTVALQVQKYLELVAEEERTRVAREDADEKYLLARQVVDRMLTRASDELADQPTLALHRRKLLEEALAFYQQALSERATDAAAR